MLDQSTAASSGLPASTDEVMSLDRLISLRHDVTTTLADWARVVVDDRGIRGGLKVESTAGRRDGHGRDRARASTAAGDEVGGGLLAGEYAHQVGAGAGDTLGRRGALARFAHEEGVEDAVGPEGEELGGEDVDAVRGERARDGGEQPGPVVGEEQYDVDCIVYGTGFEAECGQGAARERVGGESNRSTQ
jgi:hypothetical protein